MGHSDEFNSFDDAAVKKIAHTVGRLKSMAEGMRARMRSLETRTDQNAVQVRTAITGPTKAVQEYPSSGCQFPFRVYDLDFDANVVGTCPATDKRAWAEEHVGRTSDGGYLAEGTEVLYVEIPSPDGRHFWIFAKAGYTPIGTVLFALLEDRTREVDEDGKSFGRARAVVQETVGEVPVVAGDEIVVRFGGQRWLGAVGPHFAESGKGCEGIADYYYDGVDFWIVKECQELSQGFWFTTKYDRDPLKPNEDVVVAGVTKLIGHANADWPVANWKQISVTLTVRFLGLTFPYAFQDALGYAVLDVDIQNTQDNSTMRYYVVQCDQGAILNEVYNPSFCPEDDPQIDSHEPATWFPHGQRWPDELIETAYNRMDLASMEGGLGVTLYSHVLKQHILLNTEHAPYTVMLAPKTEQEQGSENDLCTPQQRVIQAMSCTQPEAVQGMELDYAITSATLTYEETDASGSGSGQECSEPKLKLNMKRRPFWYCGEESGEFSSVINLEQMLVTTDIDDDGDCIYQEQTHIIVFGSCDIITENVVCTTDEQCSGSGSG